MKHIAIWAFALLMISPVASEARERSAIRLAELEGRTWLITPGGGAFFAHGITHVSNRSLRTDYKAVSKACEDLGFNAYGYGCPIELKGDMPYLEGRNYVPISTYRGDGNFRFVDIFDPREQRKLTEQVKQCCLQNRDNPNLIGYCWTDLGAWPLENSVGRNWVDFTRDLPADAPGRKAYAEFMKTWQGDDARARDLGFLRVIARETFRVLGEANRKHDPDHLIFGDRFAFNTIVPEVLEELLPWVDAIAIQPPFQPGFPKAKYEEIHKLTGKPILICDFAIRFKDGDKAIRGWKLQSNARVAGDRYAEYIRAALETPYIIGAFWCNPVDSTPAFNKKGIKQGLFGDGLTPRPGLSETVIELNRHIAQVTPEDRYRETTLSNADRVADSRQIALAETALVSPHDVQALTDDYSGKNTEGIEGIVSDVIAQRDWRRDAYRRIDQHRKADLNITVKDPAGRVLPNTEITIEQTDHEFPFGMVVASHHFFGKHNNPRLYRKILPHFCNKIGLSYTLKLRHGPSNEDQTREIFEWAKQHGMDVRGHCLIWPHAKFLPMDVERFVYGRTHRTYAEHLASNPRNLTEAQKEQLRSMVAKKIADWAAKWDVSDWDVINETRVNNHLMDILGKEVMVDWFRIARTHTPRPDAGLLINENQVITGSPEEHEDHIDNYLAEVQFLVDHGAPITGIGFQGRMSWDISAEEMWERINRFNRFGLNLSITEMQVQRTRDDPSLKEHKKAELMERAMTIYFSHPMVDQIFQWDFMALGKRNMDEEPLSQKQKKDGRALVWGDGTLKLNGKIYLWLINNHWRTNETVRTDENGVVQLRGFKGTYRIRATHNGHKIDLGTVRLSEGGCETELTLKK